MMRSMFFLLVVTLLLCSGSLCAQDLYSSKGVKLESAEMGEINYNDYLGSDDQGYIYQYGSWGGASDVSTPVACYLQETPEELLLPAVEKGTYYAAMAHDDSGVYLYGNSAGGVRLGKLRCGGPDGYTWESGEYAVGSLPELVDWTGEKPISTMIMSPDHAYCFITKEGLWCGRADDEEGSLEFNLEISLEEVFKHLEVDPGLAAEVIGWTSSEPDPMLRRLRAVHWLPDGRLFSIIDVRFDGVSGSGAYIGTGWLGYVLQHHEDGTISVYHKPPRPAVPGESWWSGDAYTTFADPLYDATDLFYSAELDALLVWPLRYWDWNNIRAYDPQTMSEYPAGPMGFGFYVLPFQYEQAGYLSLTQAILRSTPCGLPVPGAAIQLYGDKIGVTMKNQPQLGMLQMTLDLDALDMDDDGLSYNHEVSLGSSDYTIQSDGGTTADSVEVHITGTDPTDDADEPAFILSTETRIAYVRSGLIKKHLDELGITAEVNANAATGGAPDSPLCLIPSGSTEGECILADRVTRIPIQLGGYHYAFSPDGSYLAFLSDKGVQRLHFPSGETDTFISTDQLYEFDILLMIPEWGPNTYDGVKLFPVDDELIFVSYEYYRFDWQLNENVFELIVVAYRPGEGTLVYNHQQARCDSGMGPSCDPVLNEYEGTPGGICAGKQPWTNDMLDPGAAVAGWFPEIERLLRVTATTWSRHYVALHPDEPPVMLMGGKYFQGWMELMGMPAYVMPTGHKEYFTGWGFLDGYLNAPFRFELSGMGPGAKPVACWGDIIMTFMYSGATVIPWEVVRYQGKGDPGDVLTLTYSQSWQAGIAYMMLRSGPRGGLAQAWDRPVVLYDPWGMDMGPDGLLCLTVRGQYPGDGKVEILASEAPDQAPSKTVMTIGGTGDVTDCHMGDDGSVYILHTDPPCITRLPQLWVEEWEVFKELPADKEPLDLIVAPDGSLEVLYKDGPVRGFIYLKDGRKVEMGWEDYSVTVDGEFVTTITDFIDTSAGAIHTHARFIERPDGLVVAVPFASSVLPALTTNAWVLDPDKGGHWLLSPVKFTTNTGNGLAIMPGGKTTDPWAPYLEMPSTHIPDQPDGVAPPTTGSLVEIIDDSSGGCSNGRPGGGQWLIFGMLILLLFLALISLRAADVLRRRF